MKQLFRKHQEIVLSAVGFVLLIFIIGFFVQGLRILTRELSLALNPPPASVENVSFDIEGAKSLRLEKGSSVQ